MKVVDLSNTFGNFSNHLYFSLMMYILEKKNGEEFRYIRNGDFYKFNLLDRLSRFGADRFSVSKDDITNQQLLHNIDHPFRRYHQIFNIDFTLCQLESFIRDIILDSDAFKNARPSHEQLNDYAVHFRCCDYLGSQYDCFDRIEYLRMCFGEIGELHGSVHVFTDDQKFVKEAYEATLLKSFDAVIYQNNTTADDDFVNLSLFRHKIICNSTFSYWAAFIGNVFHKNSYLDVISPAAFHRLEPLCNHVNPLWRVLIT